MTGGWLAGQKAVSRYKICIVIEAAGLAGRWARRAGRAGLRDGRAGPRAGREGPASGALGVGARPMRSWVYCWASMLCTWCTQPVLTQF